ncbi:MAG: MotA/TolQ/ExbB proton channel family protein [Flavobacteriales bacterium]|nr:MotA/TolQ/ExbB proton channel family protein [Flavobacteriales bacterium]
MKKGISFLAVTALAVSNFQVYAQEAVAATEVETESQGFIYSLRQMFIDGDPAWMSPILICLILGLAFVIERILYLNSVDVNNTKVVRKIEEAYESGGISEAREVATDTKGPIASIFNQALIRKEDGQNIDEIEKSVIGYGGVEMGKLERNLPWVALFIAIAPMLGFMGTVVGMVYAFGDIETSGTVQAADMAGNIKISLLTTLFGLVSAIILQIFYNYLVAKIDSIVNKMEDSSIAIIDFLAKNK